MCAEMKSFMKYASHQELCIGPSQHSLYPIWGTAIEYKDGKNLT